MKRLMLALLVLLPSPAPQAKLPTDLQAFCERLAERAATPAAVAFATGKVERTLILPGSPRVLGGEWDPIRKTLTVFEAADSKVTVLNAEGTVQRSLGRSGEGPAEFRLQPMFFGSRQRFRSGPDGRVLVFDDRFGHLFMGPRQVQEVHLEESMGPIPADVHVARVEGGWIVSAAKNDFTDRSSASVVRLFMVRDQEGVRQEPVLLGTLLNGLAPLPVGTRAGQGMPYDWQYRRVWDAMGARMALVSKRHFALCVGSPADSATWKAWRVDASRRAVDEAERNRLLKERYGRTSGPMPMAGTPIEEVFRGRWPEFGPFYHDVTVLNDSTYAAIRLDPRSGLTADLISTAHGYRRSFRIPEGRGVIGGYRDGLLLLDLAEGTVEFLAMAPTAGSTP